MKPLEQEDGPPVQRINLGHYLRGPGLGPLLVRASTGSLALRVGGMALSFATGLLLARGLGTDGYGVYGLAMSIIAIMSVPAEFGLPQLVTREVSAARAKNEWGRLTGVLRWASNTAGLASIALALIVGGGLILGYGTNAGGLASTLLWGVVLVPLVAMGKIKGAALRGLQHIVEGQIPELVLRPGLFAAALVAAFLMPNWSVGPADAMALHAIATFATFIFAVVLLRRRVPECVHAAPLIVERREWIGSAIPLGLTEGLRVAQGSAGTILLGILSTTTAVGLYRVAARGALLCAIPIGLFNVIAAPLVADLFAKGELAKLQRMLGLIAAAMFGGVLLLSLPFFIAGADILGYVFGDDYRASYFPLWLLCVGQVLSAFAGANSTLLNMSGHEGRVTLAFVASLVANLIVAASTIPFLQATGAAVGWVAGSFVWNVLLWRDSRRILGIDTSLLSLAFGKANRLSA